MAKEGFYFYLPFVILTAVFFFLFYRNYDINYTYWAVAFFMFGNLLLLFFRDPQRKIPEGDDIVVAPADGKVVSIEEHDGYRQISIFLSIFNVHVNRVPMAGRVNRVKVKPGKYLAAFNKQASEVNQRTEIDFETDRGQVRVHLIAGILARRIKCRVSESQTVKKGDRLGLIMFGSRVDLFIPLEVKVDINIGDKVKGAKTIIGRFV